MNEIVTDQQMNFQAMFNLQQDAAQEVLEVLNSVNSSSLLRTQFFMGVSRRGGGRGCYLCSLLTLYPSCAPMNFLKPDIH